MTAYYLGLDPGLKGGIGVIDELGLTCVKSRSKLTEKDVWLFLKNFSYQNGCRSTAVIERVSAMPGNGVSGMFKFGQTYGFLRGLLIAADIPFQEVSPVVWQRKLGIPKVKGETKPQRKRRLKEKAQQLFPLEKLTLETADSLLLAEYCRRLKLGKV